MLQFGYQTHTHQTDKQHVHLGVFNSSKQCKLEKSYKVSQLNSELVFKEGDHDCAMINEITNIV